MCGIILYKYMTFEEQFNKRIKMETLGGTINIIDIHPSTEKVANYPVLIASGWASTPELLKPLLKEVYENNNRVITIDFKKLDKANKKQGKYTTRESFKAKAIIDVLEKLNLTKVDIIGHSEGGVYATLAIEMDMNKFRKSLLIAPAGMIPNESFIKLVYKFVSDFFLWPFQKIQGKNRPFYHIIQNLKFLLFNPMQSLGEGYGLSKIKIGGVLDQLIKKGVSVNLICFKDDLIFPYKLIEKTAKKNNIPFHLLEGNHNYIYSEPKIFWSKVNSFLQ